MKQVETLSWSGDAFNGTLALIDQTLLPTEFVKVECRDVRTVWEAIKSLRVRGAPAIGIAAAYGVCLGLQSFFQNGSQENANQSEKHFFTHLEKVAAYLASSRPTAVNLFWALDRMKKKAFSYQGKGAKPFTEIAVDLLDEAKAIHEEDRIVCRTIGTHGNSLIKDNGSYLTHCNAGGLATADYGTALAVFFAAAEAGKQIHVYADETRPLLQGARLTAWELKQRNIPVTLICDSMAPFVMRQGKVDAVIVGADRITANGDTANKIGTYGLAIAAKAHRIPFYVAAPVSTFDLNLKNGAEIPIEEREENEITCVYGDTTGKRVAPEGINVYNPAFDVTPAELITGIITEKGVIQPVNEQNIRKMI